MSDFMLCLFARRAISRPEFSACIVYHRICIASIVTFVAEEVCIAALFHWNYGSTDRPDYRLAALTASDRMQTSVDLQFEPDKQKLGWLNRRTIVLIAGEVTIHSQAIKRAQKQFVNTPDASPYDIACFYGREIQKIKLKEAEDIILAPLGLNTDTFTAQQRDLDPNVVMGLKDQLQGYRGEDVEAILVGSEDDLVQLYAIDSRGIVTCCDDISFAAIGIGAWHAKSFLMQSRYSSNLPFVPALAAVYGAKRSAEVAPGVGKVTDLHIVHGNRIQHISTPELMAVLDSLYDEVATARRAAIQTAQDKLAATITRGPDEGRPEGIAEPDAQANASVSSATSETPRRDESGSAKS